MADIEAKDGSVVEAEKFKTGDGDEGREKVEVGSSRILRPRRDRTEVHVES